MEEKFLNLKNKINLSLIVTLVMAFVFLLLFSTWTSPLYSKAYGYESSFLMMIGRTGRYGKSVYRDYFDVRGPFLFFIETVASMVLKGKKGVFLIQCIFMMIDAVCLHKMYERLNKTSGTLLMVLFFGLNTVLINGGNTLYEYLLPFFMVAMVLVYDFIESKAKAPGLFLGIYAGVCVMSDYEWMLCPLLISGFCVFLLVRRKVGLKNILIFVMEHIVGMVPVIVALMFWCISRGMLADMIGCYFILGRYCFTLSELVGIQVWMIPLVLILFLFVAKSLPLKKGNKNRNWLVIQLMVVFFLAVMIGQIIPAAIQRAMDNYRIAFAHGEDKYYDACIEAVHIIPEEERNEIYTLESGMNFFEINGLTPLNRFCENTSSTCSIYPRAQEIVVSDIAGRKHNWIISKHLIDMDNIVIRNTVLENYDCVMENNGMVELWRLKND